ncbi:hypothetical protein PFNF54_00471 [Plasmodium falciparum NF54]|uniref:Uncharacterized protein n=1 Tax=Plasmodium falciparum (isolate NF54) TaxID=5843 RepID=W7K1T1_PLAFO|nr:hypothetical protein PFNF54_00471 [Plasmodium falciparum NF54]
MENNNTYNLNKDNTNDEEKKDLKNVEGEKKNTYKKLTSYNECPVDLYRDNNKTNKDINETDDNNTNKQTIVEENNFFDNNFSDFQKAQENTDKQKNSISLNSIYNDLRSYEQEFLNNLKNDKQVQETNSLKKDNKDLYEHINFNNIESISNYLNNYKNNFSENDILNSCINKNIESFIQEEKKNNKKNKINKNYINQSMFLNSLHPNFSQKIFKEYSKQGPSHESGDNLGK